MTVLDFGNGSYRFHRRARALPLLLLLRLRIQLSNRVYCGCTVHAANPENPLAEPVPHCVRLGETDLRHTHVILPSRIVFALPQAHLLVVPYDVTVGRIAVYCTASSLGNISQMAE